MQDVWFTYYRVRRRVINSWCIKMAIYREELFQKFFETVNKFGRTINYKEKEFDVVIDSPGLGEEGYDLAIRWKPQTLALVKIVDNIPKGFLPQIPRGPEVPNVRFLALTDGEDFLYYDSLCNVDREGNLDQFVRSIYEVDDISDEYRRNITQFVLEYFSTRNTSKRFKEFEFRDFYEEIEYNPVSQSFSFGNIISENPIELEIFNSELATRKKFKRVYKYTSLESAFQLLTTQTFRLNGLVAMNDTTEFDRDIQIHKPDPKVEWRLVENINKFFISCFSLNRDDLTMWRLYGDDGKGICLAFEVKSDDFSENSIIAEVEYVRDVTHVNTIEFIQDFTETFKNRFNHSFDFKLFNHWIRFFKSNAYRVEREVRWLYQNELLNVNWFISNSSSVLAPFINLPLQNSNFPLRLVKIHLGPRCPNSEINLKQLKLIIREMNRKNFAGENSPFKRVEVVQSKINHYR